MTDVVIAWNPNTTDPWRLRAREFVRFMWEDYGFNIIWGLDDSEPFNISKAKNNGVRQASSNKVIIADADVVIEKAQILKGLLLANKTWVIPYDTYFNLTEQFTDRFLNGDVELDDCEWDHKLLSWAGMLIIEREKYWDVGGHDERFSGWGWDDNALRLSLDNLYAKHERVCGNIYHLYHPVPEGTTFGSEHELRNRKLFDKEYKRKFNWTDERLKW